MTRTSGINTTAVQHVTRIACECAELGRDPILWRRHLAREMLELIPKTVALVYEIQPPPTTDAGGSGADVNPVLIDDGWIDDGCQSAFYAYLSSDEPATNPLLGAIMRHESGLFECSAYDIAPEEYWLSKPVGGFMQDAKVEFNCMTRAAVMPSGRREVLALHRHAGTSRWSDAETELMSLLFRSIAPMFGTVLRPVGDPSITDLPPRAWGVLDGYLRGLSSKQVAAERGLSIHSVNEYAKIIHRHFYVQSRGELMAMLAGISHRHQIKPVFGDRMQ